MGILRFARKSAHKLHLLQRDIACRDHHFLPLLDHVVNALQALLQHRAFRQVFLPLHDCHHLLVLAEALGVFVDDGSRALEKSRFGADFEGARSQERTEQGLK